MPSPHQVEATLILIQYWSERKRKIIIIVPSSLRKDEDHYKVKLIEQEFKKLMFGE